MCVLLCVVAGSFPPVQRGWQPSPEKLRSLRRWLRVACTSMTRHPTDPHPTSPHSIAPGAGPPPDQPTSLPALATLVWLFGLVAGSAGCAAPSEPSRGTVIANLVGQAPSGAVFRLRHALITVSGPGTSRIWNTEDDL